ncbi:DUF2169 family type VI secretion system accessory protein [Vibrio maritimus]|uniref:DUF2169 family type VI secretion system accessory protein n=1 Tax=Vibrio maritimus TaxID=990268 RepID=UPI004067B876
MQLWDIESDQGLSLKGRFQRDADGNEVWVVAGKRSWRWIEGAWFELEESEVFDDPLYIGEPGLSAMKTDHEFAYFKANTDVLVFGKARSYAKKPTTQHECRVLLDGHIDKTLKIMGERVWIEHGGGVTVSRPIEFIEREIDYSNAVGGDERNRIGGGVAKSNAVLVSQVVPSVFYPKEDWTPATNKIRVAGFGPIPPFFDERRRYAGTFDENWVETRKPMLPCDFDVAFNQSAPKDQQCNGYLLGGERIVLSGFCHDETLAFRIPSSLYTAVAHFGKHMRKETMSIYTLFIDTETKTLSLSYNASFPCQGEEHTLTKTRIEVTEVERTDA